MSGLEGGPSPYLRGTFKQTCGFCGCVFHVSVPGQLGHEGPETYFCPECRKKFPVKASQAPTTTLISRRTDGRSNRCPNN
jgi:hypothetical protein